MIGQKLGHYLVAEKIGAGGMGEVYRAHDEHLERDVAIKVLPPGTLTDEAARKRFRKEALALSKLNHPNIATIFDFDTQDGVDFLVMELVAGESLSEKLPGRPLPEKEVLRIGAQLAQGLAAAHKQNVIHRDLKPGNLRLTSDGSLKILDFGLAKLLRPVSDTALTESVSETQAGAGTLPYMTPEQLRGEKADARSDIHAAGVVLYELATGRRPFQETLSTALTDAILHKPPPPPGRVNVDISPRLEEVILKCLEKEPDHRYQSANELLVDLRRLATPSAMPYAPSPAAPAAGTMANLLRSAQRPLPLGIGVIVLAVALLLGFNVGGVRERLFGPPTPKIESLAVLPLENLSRDPEQEYFADGMTEALITELSKISALKVISRTSVMRFKKSDKPMPQIARELNVDALIEGSVQREGDQVRITVQLIHGPTDKHLWAESYQRELRGILALQSEVARAIAREIQIALTPREETQLSGGRELDPEAYQAYLQGLYHLSGPDPRSWLAASRYFEEAVAKEPNWALAHAMRGRAYHWYASGANNKEYWEKSKQALLRALALDDNLAEAHSSLGYVLHNYDWDWAGAEKEFRRAQELNPNEEHGYSLFLMCLGRFEEAITLMRRAEQVDPLHLALKANVGAVYTCAGQPDKAIVQLQSVLELKPDYSYAYGFLFEAYLRKSAYPEALAALEKYREFGGNETEYKADLAYAYARVGRRQEALAMLSELKDAPPVASAEVYAALGDNEKALPLLERAYQQRDRGLLFIRCWPEYEQLLPHPRFQALLRRMNFPHN